MQRTAAAAVLLIAVIGTAAAQPAPRITRIEFGPAPSEDSGIAISLIGTGECTYTIDFGDGTTERRTATLPDRLTHAYKADREYSVVATPERPCEGVAKAQLDIRAIKQGIWRLSVEPGPSTEAPEVIITIEGRGPCIVLLDLGDGNQRKLDGDLPAKVNHTYAKPGSYELHAAVEAPCRGDVRLNIDVQR